MLENPFQNHYKALKWGFPLVLERIKSDKYYKHYNGYKNDVFVFVFLNVFKLYCVVFRWISKKM